MAFLEKNRLHLTHLEGVKLQLCKSRKLSIFTIGRAPAWCIISTALHTLLVLAVSLIVGLGLV